jgi:hypothetical protein
MIWADILISRNGPFARAPHDASELRELLVNTAHLPKLREGHRNTFDTIRCRVMSPFASAFAPNILKYVKLAMRKQRARAVAGSLGLGTDVIRRHRRSAPRNLETKTTSHLRQIATLTGLSRG